MATQLMLDPATEQAMDELIDSGIYASREHAVREGVRLIRERGGIDEAIDPADLDPATRQAIEAGLADIEAGRTEDAGVVFARLRYRYANWRRAAE